jgi:hypothetical protein
MSKAKVVKELRDKNIGIPKGATLTELEHIRDNWISCNGWLIRPIKPTARKPNNPVSKLEKNKTYWIPDSKYAQEIVKSQLVAVLGRARTPPKEAIVVEIPKGDMNGSNIGAN